MYADRINHYVICCDLSEDTAGELITDSIIINIIIHDVNINYSYGVHEMCKRGRSRAVFIAM